MTAYRYVAVQNIPGPDGLAHCMVVRWPAGYAYPATEARLAADNMSRAANLAPEVHYNCVVAFEDPWRSSLSGQWPEWAKGKPIGEADDNSPWTKG